MLDAQGTCIWMCLLASDVRYCVGLCFSKHYAFLNSLFDAVCCLTPETKYSLAHLTAEFLHEVML